MRKIVVINNPKDWQFNIEGVEVVAVRSYLTNPQYADIKNVRIFNLARNYWYQSAGYYVSLLAEARGQKVIPSVTTIQDLKSSTIVRVITDEIDELIQKSLSKIKSPQFALSIYFGRNTSPQYDNLSKALYNLFQAPILRAQFQFQKKWTLQGISPISVREIPESHKPFLEQSAHEYFKKKRYDGKRTSKTIYDLAILVNPNEKSPPSDKKAIQNFIDVGEEMGFYVDLITKEDYSRVSEYDALFIRETTAVNHHTYRFARRAFADGIPVIDDPLSIMRCTNKVFLAETLAKAKIPTPKTVIVHKDNRQELEAMLGFPIVLKQPDSSFSQGVIKATDRKSLDSTLDKMLNDSDLVIAQEFLPTDYDWRIGILDNKPLYACKYYMAKGHWQIYNWSKSKADDQYGVAETMPIEKVPEIVIETSLKAANLIGNGLYGVDIKQKGNNVYIIEINDNPSLDAGIEDYCLKDDLYRKILGSLLRRIEQKKSL